MATKIWTPEEIAGAKQAGIFLSNPSPKVDIVKAPMTSSQKVEIIKTPMVPSQKADVVRTVNDTSNGKVNTNTNINNNTNSNNGMGASVNNVVGNNTGNGTTNDIAKIISGGQQNKVEVKPYEKAVDNSAMINAQAEQMAAAIRAKIEQRNRETRAKITALPEKYQPDKNASEVTKAQQVRSLNEIAANQGDRGGIGRQNTLAAMVGGENRLNSINLAQKQEEAALNNEIGRLMLEGDIQEANIQAQKLRDLIANNTAMNETNYNRQFNAEGRAQTQNNWLSEFDQREAKARQEQQNWTTTNTQTQDQNSFLNKQAIAEAMGKTYDTQGSLIDSANTIRQNILDKRQADNDAIAKMQVMAQLTGNVPVQNLISQMSPEQIAQYESLGNREGGFTAAMNATNDPTQKIIIDAFRTRFLQANPNNPYVNTANPFGAVQTMQGRQVDSGIATEVLQRAAMTIDNLAKQYNLDNILPQELARAKQLISIGEAELAAKIFENSKAPEEFKMKMATMAEQISASKANTAQGWTGLSIQQQNANTKKEGDSGVKNMTTAEKNTSMASDIQKIQSYPVSQAIQILNDRKQDLISTYGLSGYESIWNDALSAAIRVGQARKYGE